MDITHLASIKELHEKTVSAAKAEKAATYHLLECLHRIEQTRAHIELAYATLFEYVHHALGYSESQSYERIAAMRLAFKVPEVGAQLKSGELSLTGVAKLSAHAKRENLKAAAVVELAERVAGRSVRELEKALAAEARVAVPVRETLKATSATYSTLTISVDSEFEALLREARELECNPTLTIAEVLKRALRTRVAVKKRAKGEIKNVDGSGRSEVKKRSLATATLRSSGVTAATGHKVSKVSVTSEMPQREKSISRKLRPYILLKTRETLWSKAQGQCEWISPVTGVRCASRQSLQIDHKVPVMWNGPTRAENLRYLCAVHNRYKGAE